MGYQESLIHVSTSSVEENNKEISKYLEIFKKYDIRCKGDDLTECVFKFHFNQDIGIYKKGMDILFVIGNRSCQNSYVDLFNINCGDSSPKYTKDEMNSVKKAVIVSAESQSEIFEYIKRKDKAVDLTSLSLIPQLPSNYKKVSNMFDDIICKLYTYSTKTEVESIADINKTEDVTFRYKIKDENELKDVLGIIKDTVIDYDYSFKLEEARKEDEDDEYRKIYKIFIDNVPVAFIEYISWSNKYYPHFFELEEGLSRRQIARLLLK